MRKINPEINSGANTEAKTRANIGVNTGENAKANAGASIGINTGANANAEANPGVNTGDNAKANAGASALTGVNAAIAFLKKEIVEQWRSYRIIVLFSVLLLFGMSSPLLAKLVPVIFESIDMGIEINIPEPTFIDAYTQFFKNMTQVCLIVVILVFSGSITREKSRGTAILLLSKGLSRTTFIMSKFIAQVLIWTVAYAASVAVFYGYTEYLFPGHTPQNLAISMLCFWLFVVFLFSISNFAGLIGNSFYVPVVITFGALTLMLTLSALPKTVRYLPVALSSWNVEIIQGIKGMPDIILPVLITAVLTIIFIASSVIVFSRQEL